MSQSKMDRISPTNSSAAAASRALLDRMNDRLHPIHQRVRQHDQEWAIQTAAGLESALEELRATEEQLAEALAELEAERARYSDLFDLAPDSYFVTDVHGSIMEANRAAIQMLNIPDRQAPYLVGKPLIVYVEPADRSRLYAAISQMQREQRGQWTLRLRPRGKCACITVDITAMLLHDPRNGRLIIRWAMRDTTQQHQAQQELHAQQGRLQELASEISRIEEAERRRIATGVHDRISQRLAVVKMLLGEVRTHATPAQLSALNELKTILDQTIDESRTLTFELSPPVLYQLGLGPAVSWLAEQIRRRHRVHVRVDDSIPASAMIPIDLRVLMFQAVRELLVNIVKHARAKQVKITLRLENGDPQRLHVDVRDSGKGFDVARMMKPQRGGFGLFNLQTRFAQIGATFDIRSKPKKGTCVTMITNLSTAGNSADHESTANLSHASNESVAAGGTGKSADARRQTGEEVYSPCPSESS